MAEIRIVNDGKEKRQSWEAHLMLGEIIGSNYLVELSGYGADESEARSDLNLQIQMLRKELDNVQLS